MAVTVRLEKRHLRSRQRNGKRKYRWVLRWEDPKTGERRCESTGTADRTEAETLQKDKWAEVNGLKPEPEEPPPKVVGPTWDDCRQALRRAMEADNLRPSYVNDSVLCLKSLEVMFPGTPSPADITEKMAGEYKRRRAETGVSPWTLKGDLATLKAVFGKWLGRECGLLNENPFANIRPPRCDEPDIRIVASSESQALFSWLSDRWNAWQLPVTYLNVAALLGWRATEIASIRDEDMLADGFVRVAAETCKTRRFKYGWLPDNLYAELEACSAGGWAFGRFSDELRRLLLVWRKSRHHAAMVKGFEPKRLVGWMQDELRRFCEDRDGMEPFTLHDFRRTAITGMQMAGVSEKEASVMVGATPEVIRKHYERLDQQAIAKRNVQRRLRVVAPDQAEPQEAAVTESA